MRLQRPCQRHEVAKVLPKKAGFSISFGNLILSNVQIYSYLQELYYIGEVYSWLMWNPTSRQLCGIQLRAKALI